MNTFNQLLQESEMNEEFFKKLRTEHHICSKQEGDLIIFYHKYYNDYIKPDTIQSVVKSVVYNTKTKEIVSDCGPNPFYNNNAKGLIGMDINNLTFVKYYDGTQMSLFFDTDKWYLSTRRCLDSSKSYYHSEKSHYELFNEIIQETEYKTFENFTDSLDKNKSYYFILIHHENKQIIDYSSDSEFGYNNKKVDNYKKLCLYSVKNKNEINSVDTTLESSLLNMYSNKPQFVNNTNIFMPKQLDRFDYNTNMICYYQNKLLIFTTLNYQLSHLIMYSNSPTISGLIFSYQNNILYDYHKKYFNKTITIKEGTFKSNDMLNILFKVSASLLLTMFKEMWSITNGKSLNNHLYNYLPPIYKEILYAIRGIYFSKKSNFSTSINKSDCYLNCHDIYYYLKYIDTNKFINFIKGTSHIYHETIFIPFWQKLHAEATANEYTHNMFIMDNYNKYRYFIEYIDLMSNQVDESLDESLDE